MVCPVTAGEVLREESLRLLWFTECRHKPMVVLGTHTHSRAAMTFVLEGAFDETIDGTAHVCGPLSLVFKPAGIPHANRYSAAGARSFIIELSAELVRISRPFADFEHFALAGGRVGRGIPSALALRLYLAFRRGQAALELLAEELLMELLASANTRYRQERGVVPAWLRRVRDRVHSDFRESLGLGLLAREADVHPVYLARAFRARFGCSIGSYLHARRMDAAFEALVTTRRPISEISADLGFHDHSHFCRGFNGVVGVAPSVIRQLASVTLGPDGSAGSDRTSVR